MCLELFRIATVGRDSYITILVYGVSMKKNFPIGGFTDYVGKAAIL